MLIPAHGLRIYLSERGAASRSTRPSVIAHCFLSCLCGSEQPQRAGGRGVLFLSCLCGSEPASVLGSIRLSFLSCLRVDSNKRSLSAPFTLRRWRSPDGAQEIRHFCAVCGSHLHATQEQRGGVGNRDVPVRRALAFISDVLDPPAIHQDAATLQKVDVGALAVQNRLEIAVGDVMHVSLPIKICAEQTLTGMRLYRNAAAFAYRRVRWRCAGPARCAALISPCRARCSTQPQLLHPCPSAGG